VGVYDTRRGNIDGVAKTRQLLRCCDSLAVSTYVTTPHCSTIARLAFGAFCLAIPFDDFCESISIGKHLKLRDDPGMGTGAKGLYVKEIPCRGTAFIGSSRREPGRGSRNWYRNAGRNNSANGGKAASTTAF
jgi:hypothetical protein